MAISDYELMAVHGVNRYLWNRLSGEGIMNATRTNGLIPIIPTKQVPTFTEMIDSDGVGGVPFIVYNYSTPRIDEDYWMETQQAVYLIYSQDEDELRKIQNLMVREFKKQDVAAANVSRYIHANVPDSRYRAFDYKNISLTRAVGPSPLESEQGRQECMVVIQIAYTHSSDSS